MDFPGGMLTDKVDVTAYVPVPLPRTHIETTSSYLADALREPEPIIRNSFWDLRFHDFDTIVCRGFSGLLIAPGVAHALGKYLFIIRKNYNSHGNMTAEGKLGRRWIFIDDFISLGGTFRECEAAVAKMCERHTFNTEYLGSYEYSYRRWTYTEAVAPSAPVRGPYVDPNSRRGYPVPISVSADPD